MRLFAAFMTTIPVYTHNTVNVGLLKQINGIDVSFFQWMIPGVIIGLVTLLALYMVIRLMNPIGEDKLFSDPSILRSRRRNWGKCHWAKS